MKFADRHIPDLLDREKTLTVRLLDEWGDMSPGDFEPIENQRGTEVGKFKAGQVGEGTAEGMFGLVNAHDGHRSYRDLGHFLDALRNHYDDPSIMPSTSVVVIEITDVAVTNADADPREFREPPRE